jgi:hypothetical protein
LHGRRLASGKILTIIFGDDERDIDVTRDNCRLRISGSFFNDDILLFKESDQVGSMLCARDWQDQSLLHIIADGVPHQHNDSTKDQRTKERPEQTRHPTASIPQIVEHFLLENNQNLFHRSNPSSEPMTATKASSRFS